MANYIRSCSWGLRGKLKARRRSLIQHNGNFAGTSPTTSYDRAGMNMPALLHRNPKLGHKPGAPKGFLRHRASAAALGTRTAILSSRASSLHFSSVDSSYAGIR
jgi:hypothetical protein